MFVTGLVFGSFFNVCIWRIPRGMSIVWPPSHCVHCHRPIRWHDNIPVLSWLLLRGRCRICGKAISARYLLVEVVSAVLFLSAFLRFGFSLMTLKAIVFLSLLVVTAFIDLDHKVIHRRITLPGLVLGIAGGLVPPPDVTGALVGGAVGAGFVIGAWLLWRFVPLFRRLFRLETKDAMGGGDVFYAAMIGAFVGTRSLLVALFAAVLMGVIIGYSLRVLGRGYRGQEVPFGPFLALGGLLGMFFGESLFALYLRLVLGQP
ncbi:MAG: prepilin peptidase [candidate division WOR-3 bacterium]